MSSSFLRDQNHDLFKKLNNSFNLIPNPPTAIVSLTLFLKGFPTTCTSHAGASSADSASTYTLTRTTGWLTIRVSTSKVVTFVFPSGRSEKSEQVSSGHRKTLRKGKLAFVEGFFTRSSSTVSLRESSDWKVEHVEASERRTRSVLSRYRRGTESEAHGEVENSVTASRIPAEANSCRSCQQ